MSIYDTHEPDSGSGLWLKLKDGETVKLRIASEPAIFESHNERDGKMQITTRYAWVVYNQDKKLAQIFQNSARFFKQVANLAKDQDWGDPTLYDIKVTRQGDGTDTIYSVVPTNNRDILAHDADQSVKAIDLIEKLRLSQWNHQVFMLSEFENAGRASSPVAVPATPAPIPDVVHPVDDGEDKPINLDDIPF